jgi:hypothetical protein
VTEIPLTAVDTVRLLIADTDPNTQLLDDAKIAALLELESYNLKLAAAQGLDTIASSEALVAKKITKEGLTTDGPAVAKALREHAAQLRGQAAATADADDLGAFEIVDVVGQGSSPELTAPWW